MRYNKFITFSCLKGAVREDTHKKSVFLVVGPIRFYPPYTNGLVVHATFFSFFLSYNSLKRILTIFLFLPKFWAKTAGVYKEKKWFFA